MIDSPKNVDLHKFAKQKTKIMNKIFTIIILIFSLSTVSLKADNDRLTSTVYHKTDYPGHLASDTAPKYWKRTTDIVIEGPMNDKDLRFLVKWATTANLEKIDLKKVTGIKTIKKGIFNKGKEIAKDDTLRLKRIVLPDNIISIEDSAFMGCTKLEEIQFGNNIKTIGKNAFENCISLSYYVDLPKSLTDLGKGAFKGCTKIHGIIFPPLLTKIKEETCYGCINLIHVGLDEKIDTIGFQAFFECPLMKFECRAIKPPFCASYPFIHGMNCNVIIPNKCYNIYKADPWWKYAKLIELDEYFNND